LTVLTTSLTEQKLKRKLPAFLAFAWNMCFSSRNRPKLKGG